MASRVNEPQLEYDHFGGFAWIDHQIKIVKQTQNVTCRAICQRFPKAISDVATAQTKTEKVEVRNEQPTILKDQSGTRRTALAFG